MEKGIKNNLLKKAHRQFKKGTLFVIVLSRKQSKAIKNISLC